MAMKLAFLPAIRWAAIGCLLAVLFPVPASGQREGWGDLSGRFVFDGEPPPAKALKVDRDVSAFPKGVTDQSLMVHPGNGGLANVVLYRLPVRGESLAVHPSYEEEEDAKIELQTIAGRFEPHVLLLRTTQTLVEVNRDEVGHNVNISLINNSPRGFVRPVTGRVESRFTEEEPVPLPIACNIHPWMQGYLVLRDTPYMAKTDENGNFEIKNLPVGTHRFRVWHERLAYLREVAIGEMSTDKKGVLTVNISEGANRLGTSRLSADRFREFAP